MVLGDFDVVLGYFELVLGDFEMVLGDFEVVLGGFGWFWVGIARDDPKNPKDRRQNLLQIYL